MRQVFSRDEHIRRRGDFQSVYSKGARIQGRHMTIIFLPTQLPVARLGIAATRKVGGSVQRNRAKRLVRELFRRHKPAPGTDVVVIPRPSLVEASLAGLEVDYRAILGRRRPLRATL